MSKPTKIILLTIIMIIISIILSTLIILANNGADSFGRDPVEITLYDYEIIKEKNYLRFHRHSPRYYYYLAGTDDDGNQYKFHIENYMYEYLQTTQPSEITVCYDKNTGNLITIVDFKYPDLPEIPTTDWSDYQNITLPELPTEN